jgi:hypothetical protein
MPGPRSLPTRKNAAVETMRDPTRKCIKTKLRARRTIDAKEGEVANPQARDVSNMKNERR